jgi:hypothetical protein
LGPPVSAEGAAFEDQFAHAWCDNIAACCQADTPPFAASDCLTNAHRIAESFAANALLSSGQVPQFNPSQVAGCLAAVTASALSCPSDAPIRFALAQDAIGEPFANVFSALAGPGARCSGFFASECAPPIRMADVTTAAAVTAAYQGVMPGPVIHAGSVILGIDGYNSNTSWGTFYEGAIVAGFPTDDTELSVLRNIQAVGYGR